MRSVAHVCTVPMTAHKLLFPQLKALRDAGWRVTVICAPGPEVGPLVDEGIRIEPWPSATRAWSPRDDLRAFVELVRILRQGRFDVVHTHNPKPGVMGRIAARIARVPRVINTVHGYYAAPTDPLLRRSAVMTAEWIAARFSDVELFQSREDLAWARRTGVVPERRSLLLGNGVDVGSFPVKLDRERADELRRELGLRPDDVVVVTVARMVREKGLAEYFAAARSVRRVEPRVRFVAVGDLDRDKGDSMLPEEVDAAKEDVIFAGWREDVGALLAIADIFVLASWREGLPRSAIEAAASGLPAVLSDIRGCREVIRDGREGFLVPARDPVRLADAILRLARDGELRAKMGRAARVRAEEEFDERRLFATLVDVTEGVGQG